MYKIIFYFVFILCNPSFADTGDKLLQGLQNKFSQIEDLSANFVQSTNGKKIINGKLFFKKDDKIRIELKNSILISDGATNWNHNQKENKLIISNNNQDNSSPFSLKKIVYDYPKECKISSESTAGAGVLVLTPNSTSSIGYSLVKIWLGKDNLITKVEMKDRADNIIRIDFSNYKLNQKVQDSKFSITPAEGTKVIDLR